MRLRSCLFLFPSYPGNLRSCGLLFHNHNTSFPLVDVLVDWRGELFVAGRGFPELSSLWGDCDSRRGGSCLNLEMVVQVVGLGGKKNGNVPCSA